MTSSSRVAMFSSHLSSRPKDEFQRVCDNIDAQNRLALESGTLPPEEEAILREVTYPEQILMHGANVGKSQPIGQWLHQPNEEYSLRTRGEILAIPPDEPCDIESDCVQHQKPFSYHPAIDKPRVPPSGLLMSLMKRVK